VEIKTANTILYCTRWKETVEFYAAGLGLERLCTRNWFVEFQLTASTRLSIADETRASIKSAGGRGVTISMAVADLQSTYRALKEKNLSPTPIKSLWGSRVFYLRDPEGNRLEFWCC
jgi:catechol 2,3-dioxygenase-like lactoylglutathione lyase family enzyme